MTRYEQARAALDNNIIPLQVYYRDVQILPDLERAGIRTTLNVNSPDLGVLTTNEYRFVTARNSQCEELAYRHLKKIFMALPDLPDVVHWVSAWIPKRLVKDRKLFTMLSDLIRQFPKSLPNRVCLEIPADILYEDFEQIAADLTKAREMGFLIALTEVGDGFCPILQSAGFKFDYVFLSKETAELVGTPKSDPVIGSIVRFFNYFGTKVVLEGKLDGTAQAELDTMGMFGICSTENDGLFPPYSNKGGEDE